MHVCKQVLLQGSSSSRLVKKKRLKKSAKTVPLVHKENEAENGNPRPISCIAESERDL